MLFHSRPKPSLQFFTQLSARSHLIRRLLQLLTSSLLCPFVRGNHCERGLHTDELSRVLLRQLLLEPGIRWVWTVPVASYMSCCVVIAAEVVAANVVITACAALLLLLLPSSCMLFNAYLLHLLLPIWATGDSTCSMPIHIIHIHTCMYMLCMYNLISCD